MVVGGLDAAVGGRAIRIGAAAPVDAGRVDVDIGRRIGTDLEVAGREVEPGVAGARKDRAGRHVAAVDGGLAGGRELALGHKVDNAREGDVCRGERRAAVAQGQRAALAAVRNLHCDAVQRLVDQALRLLAVDLAGDRRGQPIDRDRELGVLPLKLRRLDVQTIDRAGDFQHLAAQVFEALLIGRGTAVPARVAGAFERHARAAVGRRHDPGVEDPPAHVLHPHDLPGRKARRRRHPHRAGRVGDAEHQGVEAFGHGPQRFVGGGGQEQVALDRQRVRAGLLRRRDDPDVVGALANLHLVDDGANVILVGQRALVVRHGGGRAGRNLEVIPLGILQQRSGRIRQQHPAPRPRPDDDVPPILVPGKCQLAVGRRPQKRPRSLRHPGKQLPPGQVIRIKRLHLVAAIARQRGVGNG